jgi:membrane protein implicated in regulation of membrane protease activity
MMVLAVAAAAISSAAASTIAPATSAAASTSAAPVSAATAILLRTSFIDYQRPPQEIRSIQRFDRFRRVRIVSDFSESKSARLIGNAVAQ